MAMKNGSSLRKILISILLIGVTVFLPIQATPSSPNEYQVKAAFLYNFAKFVEWPQEAIAGGQPFVIGILGQDPFGNELDEAVAGKTVREKKITVKRFSKIEEAIHCHLLFISNSEDQNLAQILRRLEGAPVLTVSDMGQFAEKGGVIQLVTDQNKIHFAINMAAAERVGLKPSSQLLKLSRIITGTTQNRE
ncbi:MAG: YfiR family protein [Nitrospirae bacterium]|nr:YfiR family protein [Nitrospirota bacterium]MBI3803131.1 YfiR family protein [Candidatus Manganitrophaceae bacterium]